MSDPVDVQFNPQTLKVTFANQISGGKQSKGASVQFTSQTSTKLSFQIWFDVTVLDQSKAENKDVRIHTKKIVDFLTPTEKTVKKAKVQVPPGVRFIWGTFLFDGIMTSMDETLEFFSEDGRPLRASVSVTISSQNIMFEFNPLKNNKGAGKKSQPGTKPLQSAKEGQTLQGIAAKNGNKNEYKAIGKINNIENARKIEDGTLINISLEINGGTLLDNL